MTDFCSLEISVLLKYRQSNDEWQERNVRVRELFSRPEWAFYPFGESLKTFIQILGSIV